MLKRSPLTDNTNIRPKKRCKTSTGGNPNIFEHAPEYDSITAAATAIKAGTTEVAIINLGDDFPAVDTSNLMARHNAQVLPQYRIPELSPKYAFPNKGSGMLNNYASEFHDCVFDHPEMQPLFETIAGTSQWKIRQDRMRYNPYNDDKGYLKAHIEGPNVLSENVGISMIACLTAGRTFTYYKGSSDDPRAQEIFRSMGGGTTTMFVTPSQEQLSPWQRTTIATTRPGQIILFNDKCAHEISRHNPSVSLFLHVYDPSKVPDSPYDNMTRKQAVKYKKAHPNAPPLPPALSSEGQKRQWPRVYQEMNRRECEILASLLGIHAHVWPSNKPTFEFHSMATNTWQKRYLPCFTNAAGKFQFEILTPELVQDCADFDHSYWAGCPLFHATAEEIAAMKRRYNGIPEPAWRYVRVWRKDPRTLSENLCRRRDYIQ